MTEHFFASEAIIPLRSEAREGAEMVSQLLFGEKGEILENQGAWSRVKGHDDGYEGWVDTQMILPITQGEFEGYQDRTFVLGGNLILGDGTKMALPLGACVPAGVQQFSFGQNTWGHAASLETQATQPFSNVLPIVRTFLNTPYLWGGRSGGGIDCSGLTQQVFRLCGKAIPRDSTQQARLGKSIPFGEHQVGDLAFFRKRNQERISHVGMVGEKGDFYHASGKVRLDFLDKNGIIRLPTGIVTHILVSIKRI